MKNAYRWFAGLCLVLAAASGFALETAPYTPEALAAAQNAGQPVAVQFHANWCPSCRAQDQVFESFKGDAALPITLLVVNYDQDLDARKALRVASQSTLVVFRGKKLTSRTVFETNPAKLRAALQSAL